LQNKISEYLELITLLRSNDIASLRKLLDHALNNGYGTQGIISLIRRAVDGDYLARGDFTFGVQTVGYCYSPISYSLFPLFIDLVID
jgi:hypothetical protein